MRYKGTKLERLDRIEQTIKDVKQLLTKEIDMELAKFSRLITDVTAQKDAVAANTAAWTAALQSIRDAQTASGEELPPEVEAAITQLEANTAALAAAPIANTPAGSGVVVPPVVSDTGASVGGAKPNE
jgi:predicted  nucleic acid-binding Zn-ribbon protein